MSIQEKGLSRNVRLKSVRCRNDENSLEFCQGEAQLIGENEICLRKLGKDDDYIVNQQIICAYYLKDLHNSALYLYMFFIFIWFANHNVQDL